MPPSARPAPARVVVYVRPGCHLCGPAEQVVSRVCADLGERWERVDVDTGTAAHSADELRARYGEYVPVVEVDGVQQAFWEVDEGRLRHALARTAG